MKKTNKNTTKIHTYSFLVRGGFRIDAKGRNVREAYVSAIGEHFMRSYFRYDKDGFYDFSKGWKKTPKLKAI